MSNVTVPYADPGVASFEVLDTYLQSFLLAGNHPELADAIGLPQAASTTLAQFTVVGRNGAGKIVPAFYAADNTLIQPIGVVAHASTVGAGGGNVQVFYQGCFNIDALVWDASWTSDALKLAAFNGAPTPTQIVAAKR